MMYLTMDEPGLDRMDAIGALGDDDARWRHMAALAEAAGFAGIHITPSLYLRDLGFASLAVPAFIRRAFRLTYHLGGFDGIATEDAMAAYAAKLQEALTYAARYGIHDVSLHPVTVAEAGGPSRAAIRERFAAVLRQCLPGYRQAGISLSVESHVYAPVFVLDSLADFAAFVGGIDGLGALIDISHNIYDGYTAAQIRDTIAPLRVTGFHISDALPGGPLEKGTHLPIGQGIADFDTVLAPYRHRDDLFGALEIKGRYGDIQASCRTLLRDWIV